MIMIFLKRYKKLSESSSPSRNRKGVTLLLMVVLLAAFFSIAIGIINILLGQLFLVEQTGRSSQAFYAAEIGMERALYRDRVQNGCSVASSCNELDIALPSGACYTVTLVPGPSAGCTAPSTRCVDVSGVSLCAPATRYVQRQFDLRY